MEDELEDEDEELEVEEEDELELPPSIKMIADGDKNNEVNSVKNK